MKACWHADETSLAKRKKYPDGRNKRSELLAGQAGQCIHSNVGQSGRKIGGHLRFSSRLLCPGETTERLISGDRKEQEF